MHLSRNLKKYWFCMIFNINLYPMNLNKLTKILLIFSITIFIFGSGYKLGEYNANNSKIETSNLNILNTKSNNKKLQSIDFSLFWDTWEKVEQKFVDKKKLDSKKMFFGAIKGMVASLEDPYTFFLTPDENKQSKDDLGGKFEGIGAQLGLKDGKITIIAPIKNSPSEKAGINSGDVIIKVNNESTESWTLPFAVSKIRGEKGTKVKITVLRNNEEKDFEITRDQIIVSSVELSFENKNNKNIAILKLTKFGDDSNAEWDKAVEEISEKWNKKELSGMVLDLRDNPGGYLQSSVYIASDFLPMGKMIVKQESTDGSNEEYKVLRQGQLLDIPVTVLINKGSASASEILSGALRDYSRAKLIGEKSFGKGSVQEALDLTGGAGLHVTIAKWVLPKGDWINGKGVEPDIKVDLNIKEGNTITRETDTQLEKAIEEVLK